MSNYDEHGNWTPPAARPMPDHDNHHNALLCPYCNPGRMVLARPREVEVLRAERDHARATVEQAVSSLAGIHSLMYPAPIRMEDGRTMVFRPNHPDPHKVLQELSDRIRAIPDEIAGLKPNVRAKRAGPPGPVRLSE